MGRGDVRAAVLALLAEQPMHGYQIIHEIEERSGGSWKPSAGSVYPTLQMLADEGLISAEESNGRKKTYSLTDCRARGGGGLRRQAGAVGVVRHRRAQDRTPCRRPAWRSRRPPRRWAASGTPEQVKQAVEVLDEARRKLYSILAQD